MYDGPTHQTQMPQTIRGAFERLQGDFGRGDQLPKRAKRNLVLADIHKEPEVFKHRAEDMADQWEISLHIADLQGAIRREPTRRLDPLTVWCCGGRWIVIDGHYRLEAYTRYATEQGTALDKFAVPCEVFLGDLYAAWDYSATANKKVTLPLTSTERSNAAWRRVCLSLVGGNWVTSKADVVALGLVGSNTVSRMRRALLAISEHDLTKGCDPLDLTWIEAERLSKGDSSSDYEAGWIDEDPMVQHWADRLTRTFGKEAWKAPETFFRALERYSPKLAEDLKDYLTDYGEEF